MRDLLGWLKGFCLERHRETPRMRYGRPYWLAAVDAARGDRLSLADLERARRAAEVEWSPANTKPQPVYDEDRGWQQVQP